ncbi:MAG: hypothetical protein ABUS49_03755 [Acidobacteriota bacterium]
MRRLLSTVSLALACTAATLPLAETGLTVHEWGTFTSVAGATGEAVNWLPLGGPADLPCFVNRFHGFGPKANLSGKVRMETPVLYFYAPRETNVNVGVRFPHGLITEWYPQALAGPTTPVFEFASQTGEIEWQHVRVLPGTSSELPLEAARSHYYAARETDAAPLRAGAENEKFLFYRGVGTFQPPLSAVENSDGAIVVKNLGAEEIPAVILFGNRGGKSGYRVHRTLGSEAVLAAPELNGDLLSLRADLEKILTAQGLYPKEAKAMVETWSDSWFEEGTRVFYVLAPRSVDAILPLRIEPAPERVTRVFVGRIEMITAATQKAVQAALAANDTAVIAKYDRFLEPVVNRLRDSGAAFDHARTNLMLRNLQMSNFARQTGCAN